MLNEIMKVQLRRVAQEQNLPPACLMAIVDVESGGRYFAGIDGRNEPLIRFEGHYFYRLLPRAKRNRAVANGLANARAGRVANPLRQVARWSMLRTASKIDRPAALASVSWGVGQVMGVHWRWLGFGSIDALVDEARSGLEGQVRLMAKYIVKAKLAEKLGNLDWAGFARAYNGPGYRRYNYDKKMARAYQRYALHEPGGKEPVRPGINKKNRHAMIMIGYGAHGDLVLQVQNQLGALGYHLARDGDFGPATERMVKRFQRHNRLKPDGIVGPKTFEILMRKMPVFSL